MENHPLGSLMETTMTKIREMVDVNTIVGSPIKTDDGVTLIPVSKVSFGFAGGGSDFTTKNQQAGKDNSFGGGTGAGVHITPIAFLVVKGDSVRLLSVTAPSNTVDKIIDTVPDVIDKIEGLIKNDKGKKDNAGA
jgi:sporulation protein YtfJ